MPYRVVITPEAEKDLRSAYRYIRKDAPREARKWVKRARQAAKTLAQYPGRCPQAPESETFDESIRELFFGSGNRGTYRILFVVLGQSVYVLHMRHGSMQTLAPE